MVFLIGIHAAEVLRLRIGAAEGLEFLPRANTKPNMSLIFQAIQPSFTPPRAAKPSRYSHSECY